MCSMRILMSRVLESYVPSFYRLLFHIFSDFYFSLAFDFFEQFKLSFCVWLCSNQLWYENGCLCRSHGFYIAVCIIN